MAEGQHAEISRSLLMVGIVGDKIPFTLIDRLRKKFSQECAELVIVARR